MHLRLSVHVYLFADKLHLCMAHNVCYKQVSDGVAHFNMAIASLTSLLHIEMTERTMTNFDEDNMEE